METKFLDLLNWILLWAPDVSFFPIAPHITPSTQGLEFTYAAAGAKTGEVFVVENLKKEFFEDVVSPGLVRDFPAAEHWYLAAFEILVIKIDSVGRGYRPLLYFCQDLGIARDSLISHQKTWEKCNKP
jgi:hypothetical protein